MWTFLFDVVTELVGISSSYSWDCNFPIVIQRLIDILLKILPAECDVKFEGVKVYIVDDVSRTSELLDEVHPTMC